MIVHWSFPLSIHLFLQILNFYLGWVVVCPWAERGSCIYKNYCCHCFLPQILQLLSRRFPLLVCDTILLGLLEKWRCCRCWWREWWVCRLRLWSEGIWINCWGKGAPAVWAHWLRIFCALIMVNNYLAYQIGRVNINGLKLILNQLVNEILV